jgi:hypothetical protein
LKQNNNEQEDEIDSADGNVICLFDIVKGPEPAPFW